ncbi:MAG: 30S ribosomal protein S16 [Bacteroidetes bacterium]|nr:30S ribosomal protein S16 [Bacteroidota bacterium]
MLKIRLQRHGRKQYPIYHIVAADARAPRDGKFVELLGRYNPNTNPATIELDVDKAVSHLLSGAQPTDTVRSILSYKGALMKHHLILGVKKGAMTQEQADAKFEAWLTEKNAKIASKRETLSSSATDSLKARMAAETKVREARAAALEAKRNPIVAEVAAETSSEASAEETAPEAPATEETPTTDATE